MVVDEQNCVGLRSQTSARCCSHRIIYPPCGLSDMLTVQCSTAHGKRMDGEVETPLRVQALEAGLLSAPSTQLARPPHLKLYATRYGLCNRVRRNAGIGMPPECLKRKLPCTTVSWGAAASGTLSANPPADSFQ